jgi:uncharacterized protein YneF (UPF0154 family)
MNVKTKTSLVIVFTLITGMMIGALLSRALLQNRVQRVFSMRNPNAFVQSYLETIKPDANQEKQIKEILERNGQRIAEIRSKSRENLESSMVAMMSELESVLTLEQIKRLEEKPPGGRPRFGMRSTEGELVFLTTELELTNDQTSLLKKLIEEFRMSAPDKMQRGTPKEMSPNFRNQMEKREEEIKKILTDKQKKKYDELMKNRRRRPPEAM